MKNFIIIILMMLITYCLISSEGLNSAASVLRNDGEISVVYDIIKQHAVDKWVDDHEMIVYTINNQCRSYLDLWGNVNVEADYEILHKAILKWSHDGYLDYNLKVYIEDSKLLHCDWEMVEYNFNNQKSAKGRY